MVLIGAAFKSVLKYLNKTRAGDGDRKWSVHYNTQKPQQRLLFFSGKKRSGSTDDLRGQRSTENSVSACNGLTQHGCSPPSAAPQLPFSFGLDQSEGSTARRGWKDKSRRMSSAFSDDEEKFILNNTRPLTPPMLNPAHRSSCWDVFASAHELPEETDTDTDTETETETTPRLPTPEEKMRKQAETVAADIVPINITGESFDRQASFRKVVSNTDSLSRQTRNLSRCKTLAGLPDDVSGKLDWPSDSAGSAEPVLPGGFSSAGRRVEENPAPTAERGGVREEGKSSVRRIRAPRGGGMCSLMASLTSAPPTDSSDPSRLPRLPPLPRPDTNSSLDSCGTLSASSSCCQGFHGDLQPLLPSDLAVSPSPSLAISSSYYQGDADSQFSFQTLHSSDSGDTWNYEPLSPSASDHDGVHGDWSCIATKTRRVSGEGVNSSGRSTPSHADTNSLCSEFSAFSNTSLRKHSTSSSSTLDSCSIGAARSISLRKSTRPPPPPKRSVSLMQHPSRSNTPDTQRSPQTFPDPWVPRTNTQSDFICNAGAFFEPLRPDYHTETCTLSSEQQPPNAGLSNISAAIQRLASLSVQRHQSDFNSNSVHRTETFALSSEHLPPNVSKDQQLRLNLNSETSVSSASAIQGLASPSVQRRQTDFTSNAVLSSEHFLPNVSKDQQLRLNLSSETFVSSGSAIQRLTSPLIERRQTDFNSNAALSYEHLPPNVSKDQQLRLDLNSETSVSSASAIQELASPSLQRRQSDFNSNAVLSSEHLLPNAGRSNVSKDQQLRLNLNSETSVSSAAVIQGLASSFVQRRQTDFNSNAVLSSEHFPQNVSKDQQLRLDLNAKPSVVSASVAVVQRLPSPSSGYSSQSNTPTPVSPVSPLSPSSPSSFSLPSSSQSSSSHSSSSVPRAHAISSARRSTPRFEAKPKPKPPVPERKSSLSSSSFSSTSSLSSCTSSSDSSAKLPLTDSSSSSPSPSVFYSDVHNSLPAAPPLPQPCISAPLPPSSCPTPPFLSPSSQPLSPPLLRESSSPFPSVFYSDIRDCLPAAPFFPPSLPSLSHSSPPLAPSSLPTPPLPQHCESPPLPPSQPLSPLLLQESSSPPSVFYTHIRECLPPASPLPQPFLPPSSASSLSTLPLPPPPPLATSSLTTPPFTPSSQPLSPPLTDSSSHSPSVFYSHILDSLPQTSPLPQPFLPAPPLSPPPPPPPPPPLPLAPSSLATSPLPPPPPPLAPSSIATSPLPLAPSSLATSPPPPPPPPLPLAPSSLASSPLPPPPLAISYLPPPLPLAPSSPATSALPPPPPLPLAPSSFPTLPLPLAPSSLPTPPLPPSFLQESSSPFSPFPSVFYSHICASLPPASLLTQPFLPLSPPLSPPPLPPSSRPPPPPYSSAAKASTILSPSSSTTNTPPPPPSSSPLPFSAELSDLPITDLPPLPPLPPLLPLLPLLPPPPSSLGPRGVPRPLVTAQALQGVKLRSVGKKNGSVSADARPDLEANIHAKLAGTGSPNVACNLASNEANIPSALPSDANLDSTTNSHVKQPGRKSDGDGRSQTKSGTKTPGNASLYDDVPRQNGVVVVSVDNHGHAVDKPCNGKTDRDVEKKEREKEDPDVQMYPAAPDSPWVKISHNSDKSHVSASIKCPSLQRQHATDATLSTKCSAESDLNLSNSACVVVSPEATRSQNGDQILTASSPGLNSQSHCPADSFCTSLHTHVTQSTPATQRSTRANVDANCTAIRGESVAKKTSTGSSPQTQNQPILHRKPDHSLISPKTNQPIPAPARTSEAFRGTYGTEVTDNKNAEKRRSERNPNTLKETERIGRLGNSGTFRCFGNASAYGATSAQSEAADPWVIKTRVRKEEDETDRTSRMKSSLAEDEKRREEEEEERARKTSLVMMRQKQRARKRRKRRAGRQQQQLLMMSSTMSSSSSSSSSSLSSSSGDEGERAAAAANQRPRMRMTAVSEGSCAVIGQSRALCLPGLRIHEEEEREEEDEEEEEREEEEEEEEEEGDGLLVRVSADQMFVSEQQRTTEELFTAIHRSKRKILGRRKDSADDRHRISSSSSPAVSLAVPPRPPCPPHPVHATLRTQTSARSESFKALLLRKGSRSAPSSRISAVERLRLLPAPPDTPQTAIQRAPSRERHPNVSTIGSGCGRRDFPQNTLFLFVSSSAVRPRCLTPPCAFRWRSSARCRRLRATRPMDAIYERDSEREEEEDDEVFTEANRDCFTDKPSRVTKMNGLIINC